VLLPSTGWNWHCDASEISHTWNLNTLLPEFQLLKTTNKLSTVEALWENHKNVSAFLVVFCIFELCVRVAECGKITFIQTLSLYKSFTYLLTYLLTYVCQAFETSIHPLALLLDSLVDAFLATYVGIGSHLRLLHHAVDEFKSFVTRLYLIVRLYRQSLLVMKRSG